MRLMHVADLHLDTPFHGINKQLHAVQSALIQAPYQAFERCVTIAIKEGVDLVLIAGDIYDGQRQTIAAQHFFAQQVKRLSKAQIPVVLIHGNHDYQEGQPAPQAYGDLVHVLSQSAVDSVDLALASGESVRVYGFSYPSRWVETNKVQEFPVNPRETTYTIGLLHGDLASQSEHYAPFTVPDLLSKQYDYWALGHIHQARVLNQVPLIQYAGTIQGRHRNEAGDKGAYLVELQPGQPTRSQFVSLAAIVWSQTSIECQATWQAADLMEEIQAVMASYQDQAETSQQSQIVVIQLEEAQRLSLELQEQIESGQVIDSLPAAQVDPGESFTVLAQLRLERNVHGDPFDYDDQLDQSFEAAYQSLQSGEGYRAVMAQLFDHAIMQTYLQDLTLDADLQADLVQEARDLVIQAIGTEGEVDHDED